MNSVNLTQNSLDKSSKRSNDNHFSVQNINHQQAFNSFIAGQQQQQNRISQEGVINNMPKNEPLKLVYPTTQTSANIVMNNNRATFSSAPVNGTITLSQMTANTLTQPNQQQQAGESI